MAKGKRFKFQGTTIAAVVSFGTSGVVTAITRANPAVVTQAAHGFVDGDIVKLDEIEGMTELNGRIVVVDQLTVDTYALIGVDSTNYDALTGAGTAQKAVMSPFCELTGYQESTGSTPETDESTICSTEAEFGFGLPDPGSVTLNYNYAPNSPIQLALNASRKSVTPTAVKVSLPNSGGVMVDIGVITQTSSDGAVNGNWTGSATLRRQSPRIDVAVTA